MRKNCLWLLGCVWFVGVGCASAGTQGVRLQTVQCPTGHVDRARIQGAGELFEKLEAAHYKLGGALLKAKRARAKKLLLCLELQWQRSRTLMLLARRYYRGLKRAIRARDQKMIPRQYNRLAYVNAQWHQENRYSYRCQGKQVYRDPQSRSEITVTPAPCP